MKKLRNFLPLLCLTTVLLTGCEKELLNEDVTEESNLNSSQRINTTTTIKHHYNYYGEQFTVVYHFNNESQEVLSVEGDTEQASSLFSADDTRPKGVLVEDLEEYDETIVPTVPEYVEINLRLFNTTEEMDTFINENYGEIPSSEAKTLRGPCISSQVNGNGNFHFYKHAFYNAELLQLKRIQKSVFRNHWLGNNNDQLTSFSMYKPQYFKSYTKLYEHPCYSGSALGFYFKPTRYKASFGVRNLRWYKLIGWWGERDWNDVTSSIKGWNWF